MTDTTDFSGRRALVTGGSRGIGRECARQLAARGARVVLTYKRDQAAAEQAVAEIEQAGGEALAVRADIADSDQSAALFTELAARLGGLDILIVNAAATAFKPLTEVKQHQVEKTFAISVVGFLDTAQRAVPLMGDGARIVAVSGWDSFRVLPGHGLLGAAKAAMEAIVRQLAVELAPRGILVSGVAPGPVDTDSFRTYAGDSWDDYEAAWLPMSPLGRFANPGEIAKAILFLASADNTWITGQTITIDGGISLTTKQP